MILFTILSLLFWFYIAGIEDEAITSELNGNVDAFFKVQKEQMSPSQIANVRQFVTSNPVVLGALKKMYDLPDPGQINNNSWLKVFNVTSLGILLVALTVLLTVLSLSCQISVPVWHILKENLVLFALIGVVEYLFFTRIAIKYVPIPPSQIIKDFLARLQTDMGPHK